MNPQQSPMGEIPVMAEDRSPSKPEMGLEPFVPESMETPKSSIPSTVISEDTIEIVAEPKEETQNVDEFPEGEPPMDPPEMAETPVKEMKAEEKPAMKKPPEPKKMAAVKPAKKVKITTKTTPLRVRSDPSSKAEVVAQLPTATIVPMFQETGQWYQIEYLPGKKGWISKKYSKLAN